MFQFLSNIHWLVYVILTFIFTAFFYQHKKNRRYFGEEHKSMGYWIYVISTISALFTAFDPEPLTRVLGLLGLVVVTIAVIATVYAENKIYLLNKEIKDLEEPISEYV